MAKFEKGNTIGLSTRFKKGDGGNKGGTIGFKAGHIPWNLGLNYHVKSGYDHFINGRKYCTICQVYYDKERYNTFKNPFHCDECGRRLRSVPRGRTDRVYNN